MSKVTSNKPKFDPKKYQAARRAAAADEDFKHTPVKPKEEKGPAPDKLTRYKETVLAKNKKKKSEDSGEALSEKGLSADIKKMKGEKGVDEQAAYKAKILLPKYEPVADGWKVGKISKGDSLANLIYIHVMIWLFDVGRVSKAIEFGLTAIQYGLTMPGNFSRDVSDFVFYQYYEWAAEQYKLKQPFESTFVDMIKRVTDESVHIPPALSAQYCVLNAKICADEKDYANAKEHLEMAQIFNPAVQVKTLLEKCIKQLELGSTGTGTTTQT